MLLNGFKLCDQCIRVAITPAENIPLFGKTFITHNILNSIKLINFVKSSVDTALKFNMLTNILPDNHTWDEPELVTYAGQVYKSFYCHALHTVH